MKLLRLSSKELEKIYNRHIFRRKRIEESVRNIIDNIRLDGDEALIKYTKRFDKCKLAARQLGVTPNEINGAYQNIDAEFINTLKAAFENINRFYKRQIRRIWKVKDEKGVVLAEVLRPIENVGIYIPAGTVPLVSSVYMTVLPAKAAGVKRIVLVTPPDKNGFINPHILVVASLLGVTEIYKVGGAQAIAALAFGTKTIPKVDKIVGPGNAYVTEAKRQVFGYVDIDMLAGPSEVAIIANQFANPAHIVADLTAQAEHFMGMSILITPSKALIKQVKKQIEKGYIIFVRNLNEAAEVANRIAPEHLEIMIKQPQKLLKKINNAGAIFLGQYTPTAVGDYIAGPSHVLPTGGTARFFSGLGVFNFMKGSHIITYSKKALEDVKKEIEKLAMIEGLPKHYESVKVRFD